MIQPLDPSAIPASVRAGGSESVDRFRSALGFERVLLGEMLESALPEQNGDAGPQPVSMADTLADALISRGGTGIATQLASALDAPAAPAASASPARGAAA